MFGALSETMTKRYLPQYQQFGFSLENKGAGLMGVVSSETGSGSAWVMPISPHCMVLEHRIVPKRDMQLLEITPEPYACVSEVSAHTVECMPKAHINPANVFPSTRAPQNNPVCTFVQNNCGEEYSPLKEGCLYYSRSILFERGFFEELERAYPGQFSRLFDAFSKDWSEGASHVICNTLHSLRAERSLAPGAHLFAKSVINAMVAELAADRSTVQHAHAEAGETKRAQVALQAKARIEALLAEGKVPSIEALAEQLFCSRSALCAAFKQETGISIGAFTRQKRIERAEKLLENQTLSITQIAIKLGFTRQSAFSHAFKQAHGISPTEWRELHH